MAKKAAKKQAGRKVSKKTFAKKKFAKKKVAAPPVQAAPAAATGAALANAIAVASGDHRLDVRAGAGSFDVVVDMPGVNPLWSMRLLNPVNAISRPIGADQSHFEATVDGLNPGVYLLISQAFFTGDQGEFTQVTKSTIDQEDLKLLPAGGNVQVDVLPVVVG